LSGIIIDIDPVAIQIGGTEIRWYSLAIMTGVIVGTLIAAREGKKKGINPEDIYSLSLWVVLGGIIGARLFHVMENLGHYVDNPSDLMEFQGLAIWGAVAGGGIATVIYARIKQLPFKRLADAIVPGLLVGQIIGRLGCIVNGDAYGDETGLPWGFIYKHPEASIPKGLMNVPTHPYPVYEMLFNGIILLALIGFLRRYLKTDGTLFLSYLSLYAVGRFVLSFVREEKIWFWGLQEAQVIAMIIFAASIGLLFYQTKILTQQNEPILTFQKG